MICYLLLFSLFLSQTPDCGCENKPQINVLAVVNGVKITQQDLSIETRTQVNLVQESVITARSQALNQQIAKILLETEARKRGVTTNKLLELEVTAKVVKPTEVEAKAYYNENKLRGAPDFKHVKNVVIAQIMKEREAQQSREFANSLRVAAQIEVSEGLVRPPRSEEDLSRVFATVDGVSITSRDIEQALLPLIFQVQQQVYTLRKNDLDLKINDLLLEQEAKRLGTNPQTLINQHVRMKLPIITEDRLREFHKENKAKLPGDFSTLKFQIMRHLLEQEQQKLSLAFADRLRQGAAIQIYLTAPAPPDLRQLCCNPVD